MEFSEHIVIQTMILALGVCGFMVARLIRKHKKENAPLVCPIGFDCHAVVHSDYSKFLGVPVEIFGMLYYAIVSISYICLIFLPMPENLSIDLVIVLMFLSLIAFIFSMYLIAVQIFILKKGCSWCIVSAFICLLIFILTILNHDFSFITQIFTK
jgi:uncharacterized membrane protein